MIANQVTYPGYLTTKDKELDLLYCYEEVTSLPKAYMGSVNSMALQATLMI